MRGALRLVIAVMLTLAGVPGRAADLIGHGGPVRSMALAGNGGELLTASFDSTVIRWSLARSVALEVLRFHEGAVNAVVTLPDGRFASAGEDARIALWTPGAATPVRVFTGHSGPVAVLAVSPDGSMLASGAWDGTARLWTLDSGAVHTADHKANVNGLGFLPDGRLATAAYDGTLRILSPQGTMLKMIALGAPLSSLLVAPGGEIVVAGADGKLRFVGFDGQARGEIAVSETPLSSIALSRDGRLLAAAGFKGTLAIIDREARQTLRKLEGPAFPVWSLGFSADGRELLTGGANRAVRRWVVATGEPVSPVEAAAGDGVPAALRSHPGAEVFKACSACHTLTPDDGNRAGPTLAKLYGRKIATAPGYDFSPALKKLDIVWTEETVQKLFEIGPMAYTPGTKMPEQKILNAEDRQALAAFLAAVQGR